MQAFDDFDFGSAEEYYSPRRMPLVKCDCCGERVLSNRIHIMQSFQHPETDLVVCDRCYYKMTKGEEKRKY